MKHKSDVIFEIDTNRLSSELKAEVSKLSKLACETDASWENYCKSPSEDTWGNYVRASTAEDEYTAKILFECGSEKSNDEKLREY